MGVHHAKLAACLMTLVFFCTWVCRGEVLDSMDEEYLVHDYVENEIQGVSGEDENSNQLKWSLDTLRTLMGLQASLKAVADAPSPIVEPPSYDNSGSGNNNNDNNSIPFLPLGPSLTTPTPPDHEFSSPAFNFNAPMPVYRKKSGKGKVIVVSVVVIAAVTLVVAGLLFYYMHWRFVGNGRPFEEQPRSERGLLNSSVSEGSDFFKGLNASELGTLHEGSDLAYSFNKDKFERMTFPTFLEHNGTIGSPELQAMRVSKKPTRLPSLECPSDDDSYHSTCETPSTDSKRPSQSRLPAWDLQSSHSSPSPSPSSSSSSPPPSSSVKSTSFQIAAGSFFPPPKQDPPKPPPTPIPFRPLPPLQAVSVRSPPVQLQSTACLPNSQEAKQPCTLARDSQSSLPPLPPHPPPLFSRTGQNSNQSGPPKGVQQFNAKGRNETDTPLPKLKPLYWDKVRAPPERTMVWNRLRSGSFELDEEMIESLFGCNTTNTVKSEANKSSVVHPPAKDQPLLDPKKSQNIAILLRALNVTREEVCDALLQGTGLTTELLETLVKMAPTREEEARLKEYNGDISKLGPGERFIKALLDIPYAFQRVDAMLFKANLEEEVTCIRNSLETLELACKELRCSRLFLKLLEAVLKTGNRMNVGTFRGEAQAFKLDALLKLVDIKGVDGKTTLLHFVVLEIIKAEGMQLAERSNGPNSRACTSSSDTKTLEDKEQDYRKLGLQLLSGLSNELHNVKKAAGIDSQALISSLSNISEGLIKIGRIQESELQGLRKSKETNQNITHGNFHQSMACFLHEAEDKISQLQKEEERVFSLVKDITEYFHGDCEKEELHPIRIFVIVRDFLAIVDNVCKEVSRMKQNFQTSAQKGSSMISTHKSSHSLFPTTLNKKPHASGNESVSP